MQVYYLEFQKLFVNILHQAPLNLVGVAERKLIREGQVAKAGGKKNAQLFLFNDILLITEPAHSNMLKYNSRIIIQQNTRLRDVSKGNFIF